MSASNYGSAAGPPQLTLQNVANVVQDLQTQLGVANSEIQAQKYALQEARGQLSSASQGMNSHMPQQRILTVQKVKKPSTFSGKGSITSWCTQMSNYVKDLSNEEAITVAVSYLGGGAHEWWMIFHATEEGTSVQSWSGLRQSLIT